MAPVTGLCSQSQTITLFSPQRDVPRPFPPRRPFPFLQPGKLPVELIGNIFFHACATNYSHLASGSQAICLSHVCRSWRTIALSTSSLWTKIALSFPLGIAQISRTTSFLHRSKLSKLDLHLDFRDSNWCWGAVGQSEHPFGYKEMMPVMDVLIPHVARWRSVDLLADTWAPIYTFLSYCQRIHIAPALTTVSLSRCDASYAESGETFQPANLRDPIMLFGHAPLDSLKELILSGVHIDWSSACFRGLKSLELAYLAEDVVPTVEEFVNMFDNCPQLEKLTIMGRGPNIDTVSPTMAPVPMRDWLKWQSRIRLDHLKYFTFGFTDITYAVELLFFFQLPALKSLTLDDMETTLFLSKESYSTALLDVLSSSSSGIKLDRIETLELRGVHAGPASVTRFLRHCPSVVTLITTDCTQLLVDTLSPLDHEPDQIILPCLSEIHLGSCAEDSLDTRKVFEAVFDRFVAQKGASALKKIYISDSWNEEPCDEDMALLLASGVKLLSCA